MASMDVTAQAVSMVSLGLAFVAAMSMKRPLLRLSKERIGPIMIAMTYALLGVSLLGLRFISPLSALMVLTLALSGLFAAKLDPPDSLAIGMSASLVISAFLSRTLIGWAWPVLLLLVAISPLGWIRGAREGGEGRNLELGGYELTLAFLILHSLAQLSYVWHFLPYYISFDPVVHQHWARIMVRAPWMYNRDYYVGYHSALAFAHWLTGAGAEELVLASFWMTTASLLLVYSAFRFLPWREHALLVYGGFSSFLWIGGMLLGLSDPSMPIELAHLTENALFWREPVFLWGFPVSVAIGLLAYSTGVLGSVREGPIKGAMIGLLTISLFSVHVVEAVLLVLLVVLASLLGAAGRWSAGGALAGSALSLLLSVLVVNRAMTVTSIGLIAASSLALSLLSIDLPSRLGRKLTRVTLGPELEASAIILLATGLLLWVLRFGTVWNGEDLGVLPWYLYPALLGVSAFLAVPSLRRGPLAYTGLVVASLLLGKAVSVWNAVLPNALGVTYWEYRFVPYVAMALSPLAGRTLASLVKRGRSMIPIVLIILLVGTASRPIVLEFWRDLRDGAGPRVDSQTVSAAKELAGGTLLLLSNYTIWATLYGEPSRKRFILPFWLSEGPEVAYYSLNTASSEDELTLFATAGEASVLWSMNSSRSYSRSFIWPGDLPTTRTLRRACPPVPRSGLALIFPDDTYLRRRAMAAYELIRAHLPAHTTYAAGDPTAPHGIYLGSPSEIVRVSGEFPHDPESPLYIYKIGPWLRGLRLVGDMGLLVSSFELDEGTVSLEACPERMNGTIGIAFQYVNKSDFSFAGVDLSNGEVLTGRAGDLVLAGGVEVEGCLSMSLWGNGTSLKLRVGNATFHVGRGRIGVVGISARGYLGNVSVEVNGTKEQEVPPAARIVDVVGDGGDWGIGTLVDSYFNGGRRVEVDPPSWLIGRCDPLPTEGLYYSSAMHAEGLIGLSGLLVGSRPALPLSGETVEVTASEVDVDGELGDGFYIEVDLADARLAGLGTFDRLALRLRTPVNLTARGRVELRGLGSSGGSPILWRESVEAEGLNATILAADKTILFEGEIGRARGMSRQNGLSYLYSMAYDLLEFIAVASVALIIARLLKELSPRTTALRDLREPKGSQRPPSA